MRRRSSSPRRPLRTARRQRRCTPCRRASGTPLRCTRPYHRRLDSRRVRECATAPGPYFGSAALAVTTISPTPNTRETVVLGGTVAAGTLGLYVFNEPTFVVQPTTGETISHNAAPNFSKGKTNGVGFGICTTTVTPCAVAAALTGAQGVAPAKVASVSAAPANTPVVSGLASVPAGFYDGIGVPIGYSGAGHINRALRAFVRTALRYRSVRCRCASRGTESRWLFRNKPRVTDSNNRESLAVRRRRTETPGFVSAVHASFCGLIYFEVSQPVESILGCRTTFSHPMRRSRESREYHCIAEVRRSWCSKNECCELAECSVNNRREHLTCSRSCLQSRDIVL